MLGQNLCVSLLLAICWHPGLCHIAVAHCLFLCISGSVQTNPCPLLLLGLKHSANPTDNRHNQWASSQMESRTRVRRDQRQMSAVDRYSTGWPRNTVFRVSVQLTLGGWSHEAFYHLGLPSISTVTTTGGPVVTPLGIAFKSPWRGNAWTRGWELTPEI